jgi:hypothetical protein
MRVEYARRTDTPEFVFVSACDAAARFADTVGGWVISSSWKVNSPSLRSEWVVSQFEKDRALAASARRICCVALGPMPCN